MVVKRGEIYWVDFGAPRGSEQAGKRPALVIQNDVGNENSTTTIVAAITSQKKPPFPFHVAITATESGLPKDGTVLLEQLLTIAQDKLLQRCGELSPHKIEEVDRALKLSLALK